MHVVTWTPGYLSAQRSTRSRRISSSAGDPAATTTTWTAAPRRSASGNASRNAVSAGASSTIATIPSSPPTAGACACDVIAVSGQDGADAVTLTAATPGTVRAST